MFDAADAISARACLSLAQAAIAALCCMLLANGICPARGAEPLVLEREIPLPDVSGRIDHMALDVRRKRLFVAELGNGTVDVVDIAAGKLVHRIAGLHQPQGIAYLAGSDLIVVSDAQDGRVSFFDGSDFLLRGTLSLKSDADNVRLDHRSNHVLVGYGSGGLAIIDPVHQSVLRNVPLAGHPEGFQLDRQSSRAFVNVPDAGQIAVVDLAEASQTASWPTPGAADNFPMAIDRSGTTIAVVFRSPPRLELLNSNSGVLVGSHDTCGDADDVFFDDERHDVYVTCGSGAIDVFSGTNALSLIARISTAAGARTSLFAPELDRLFVAARRGQSRSDAAILVFRPS